MKFEPSSTIAAHCEAARLRAFAAFGAVASRLAGRGAVGLERQPPLGGERVLVDLVFPEAHWTTISLNRTALMRLGAIAALTRRVSSSLRR